MVSYQQQMIKYGDRLFWPDCCSLMFGWITINATSHVEIREIEKDGLQ